MKTNSISTALLLLPILSVALSAGPSKIAPDLAKMQPASKVDVIIQCSTHSFSKINAAYTIPPNPLDALSQNPEIIYISLDRSEIANATWGSYLVLFANVVRGAENAWTISARQPFNALRSRGKY